MIDWNKPIRTKARERAELTQSPIRGRHGETRLVIIRASDGDAPRTYHENGQFFKFASDYDLENVPEKIKVEFWLGVHKNDALSVCSSPVAVSGLIGEWAHTANPVSAVKHITFEIEPGEGLPK